MRKKRINCLNCKHFYVTWEKEFPRGCKAMGFKSKNLPSEDVYNSSGMNCLRFERKRNR
ncbi:MAG: uracil-DNA glycosylase [Candidatus Anammoxibacter sp.]